MPIKTRDLTRDWRRGDAERLAQLFNDASAGWPGGAWDPTTPEEAERRIRDYPLLGVFVADEGDHFAALCSLYAKPTEKNRAYIPLLTALPSYHGKGYGKAVLHCSVERTYELGIARVDLHTWPGNLKAVPLYKKIGFMWSPGTPWYVLMQNFTTGARWYPAAQNYFRRHDWYRTMKRDLTLVPDDHKHGKVRVYPYEWEEEGDKLRMVYDRQSWGLIELETNEFLVGCYLEDEKLVTGLPQLVRWQIVNYTGKPLEVALFATGDEGVVLNHTEFLQVRTKAEMGAEFNVLPEIREKEREPKAPIIHTEMLINGTPISLAAGFEAKQAVRVGLDADAVGLRLRRPEQVTLQVWSELNKPADVTVHLSPTAGVTLGTTKASVHLPANGSAEVALPITAAESGLVEVKVETEVQYGKTTLRPKSAMLSAHAIAPGEVVGRVEKERVVVENAVLRMTVNREGGWVEFHDKIRNRQIANAQYPLVGPPLAWDEFFETTADARLEQDGERVTAVLTTPSIHRPGVRLEWRLTLSNMPLVEMVDTIINGSTKALSGKVQTRANMRTNGPPVLMTSQGLVRGPRPSAGRQFGEHNVSEDAKNWPEGWIAQEDKEGMVSGVIWEGAQRILWQGGGIAFERLLPSVAPGQSLTMPPSYIYAGEGTALTVRRWWQMLYGKREPRYQRLPEARQPLEFGLDPRPAVIYGDQAEAWLTITSIGRLEFSGVMSLQAPAELEVQPKRLEFNNVCETQDVKDVAKIRVCKGAAEGGYFIESALELDRMIHRERQPVLVLGNPAKQISVKTAGENDALLRVENGILAMTLAPGFNGAAISLTRGKEELLRSAYPEARPLAWENSWHGGILPGLDSLGFDIAQEKFTARIIERRGSHGIMWRGVRMSCSPRDDRARHDKLELDYLMAPGSNVFAVALRTTRRTDTAGYLEGSFTLWPVLGGSYLMAHITTAEDTRTTLVRTGFERDTGSDRWVIAENPDVGQAVLIAYYGREANVFAHVYGEAGYFLGGSRWGTHEARETRETIYFICFTETDRARNLAEVLSQVKGLP